MRQSGLLVLVLLGFVGCSNSPGITSPREIGANLSGLWLQSPARNAEGTVIDLHVSGTTVTGGGIWSGEAGAGGSLVVTGVIDGSQIDLQFAEDNGTTLHYTGEMMSADLISGEFVDGLSHRAANYQASRGVLSSR